MPPKYNFDVLELKADDALFLSRQLEQVRAGVYEIQYPSLQGTSIVPVNTSIDPGVEVYTAEIHDFTGTAELTSDYSSRGPRADLKTREISYRIRSIKASYGYSLQELRASAWAKRDIPGAKARAARHNVARKVDETIFFGSKMGNLPGFTNNPDVATYNVAGAWASATAANMFADMAGLAQQVGVSTKYIYETTDIAAAPSLLSTLANKIIPDAGGKTVLNWFKEEYKHINLIPAWRLETAGAGGKPMMIAYNRHPDFLEALLPVEYEQLPPQVEGFETVTQCHARCGGTAIYHPGAVLYAAGMVA